MSNDLSPLDKARELLRQMELEDSNTSEGKSGEGPSPAPVPGSNKEMSEEIKAEPAAADAYTASSASQENVLERVFSIQAENVLGGIIYSEVLSKPRALRRGRW